MERSEEFYKSIDQEFETKTEASEGTDKIEESNFYETEIGKIEVKTKLFLPPESNEKENLDPKKAIIFLPGYGVEAGYESVRELAEGYAKHGNEKVYSVSTRTEKVDKSMPSIKKLSSLHYEAEAVVEFIKEKGLNEIRFAGYSQGGEKAAEIALIIQEEHPEINIENGIILLDSVGIADQSASKLKRKFFTDALLTPPGIKPVRAGLDILITAIKEAGKSNTDFFKRIQRDTEAMAGLSYALEKLKIPVVLVQGEKDMVSRVNEIIPDSDAKENDREGYLKEHIFKNSPYVRMIISKIDSHHGMPTYNSDQITKTSLYMLDRFKRKTTA